MTTHYLIKKSHFYEHLQTENNKFVNTQENNNITFLDFADFYLKNKNLIKMTEWHFSCFWIFFFRWILKRTHLDGWITSFLEILGYSNFLGCCDYSNHCVFRCPCIRPDDQDPTAGGLGCIDWFCYPLKIEKKKSNEIIRKTIKNEWNDSKNDKLSNMLEKNKSSKNALTATIHLEVVFCFFLLLTSFTLVFFEKNNLNFQSNKRFYTVWVKHDDATQYHFFVIMLVYNKCSGIILYILFLILCQNGLYYIYSNRDILYSKHSRCLLCTCFVLDFFACVHTRKRNIHTQHSLPRLFIIFLNSKSLLHAIVVVVVIQPQCSIVWCRCVRFIVGFILKKKKK